MSVVLVLMHGFIGVPLGQLVGTAVILPWLISGLGPSAVVRVLTPAARALIPIAAAIGVGALTHRASLEPAVRGLVTSGVMTLTYGAAACLVAPGWLRVVRDEALRMRGANA